MVRIIADDTELVFLSDCHIGGDGGRDIFETPDDLAALFDELAAHAGPLELLLAGDFFDCLRIADVAPGTTRVGATLARPEYAGLFDALKRLAATPGRRVTYLPGNHDAEVWWNETIRGELVAAGLVHDFALSYAVAYESDPEAVIYCEHGNEFDAANTKHDYDDPWDTPFGDHIVTDVIPRLPGGWAADVLQLREVDRVFPLDAIPAWIASRLFYTLVDGTVRWLLVPLAVAFAAFEVVAYFLGYGHRAIEVLFVKVAYDIAIVVVAAAVFFFIARRITTRAMRSASSPGTDQASAIHERLARGEAPPFGKEVSNRIAVFVSGHTHLPALATFVRGKLKGVVVNSGCWLRQLQRVAGHFRAPAVFAARYVQTHVRVRREPSAIAVELWERRRPAKQRLRLVEHLAILGRVPRSPPANEGPRIRQTAWVETA